LLVDSALSVDGYAMTLTSGQCDVPADVREAFLASTAGDFDVSNVSLETARDGFRKRQRFVGMLHEAGARLLAALTVLAGQAPAGAGLQNELALWSNRAQSASCAAGRDGHGGGRARQSETLGTLESGKLATSWCWSGPLADIHNARRVRTVIKAGRVLA